MLERVMKMISLYIDTHSENIVLALYKEEKLLDKMEITEKKDHSTTCMPALKLLLERNSLTLGHLNDIVVVIGPGSFTGVRLGVTIAKTLAFTTKKPIRSLTSLELYLQEKESVDYLAIPEKNGYFIGKINHTKKGFLEYQYLSKKEYQQFEEKVRIGDKIDYDDLMQYAHQKEELNPHQVNPFYVKKIEVEK